MQLVRLVATSRRGAATRSRREKVALFAELFRALGADTEIGVAYLSGEVPGGKLSVGPALLRRVVEEVAPAQEPVLELAEVQAAFDGLRALRGSGSATERARRFAALLGRATRDEQQFLVALALGELRQGALAGIAVDAVARAAGVPAAAVRRAVMLTDDLPAVARRALEGGEAGLARFGLVLFRPVQPMLAQTSEGVEEALAALGHAAFEYKLDGARVQLHKRGDEVRVFSRTGNDVTASVPELVEGALATPARELVLDGEAIALRPDGRPQPFQVTMRRFGRKRDVAAARAELPLSVFWFDALLVDADELLDAPAEQRSAALAATVPACALVPRAVTNDPARAAEFLSRALAAGHEGVMAKALDGPYEAGRRGKGWLKIKAVHTLDLVVLAAEWGSGRRRGFLSNLHLGARDAETGAFVMLGKTFKGLTDELLAWQTERLLALETGRDAYTVYVRPELVVEIAVNELQASPHYPAGLALRFARVKRYRPDKAPSEADTLETVRALHAGA